MQLPILATGAIAWKAGHAAIQTGAFRFQQTGADQAYSELRHYAAQQARTHIAQLKGQFEFTPHQQVQLFATYVHAFLNGALDEAAQLGQQPS